ncbi:MAG: sigma-70 family RNA polymerase sigma factor [Planctomycetes bacterium]|nr:sigma-70 family RNA polymerase sigma factor [Planctomycetota bacterium]
MVTNSNTQATLLNRLQDGSDPLAWDEFFSRYWTLIFGFARHRGCSEHTAEEIVQDVMLKVFEQKDLFNYDPVRGRFRDWLGTLVRNRVAQRRRGPAERVRAQGGNSDLAPTEPQAHDDGPAAAWEVAFEQSLLLVLLDVIRREMDPRAYLAFELYALHDLPGGKVAKYTGLSRNGVYRAHKRAIRRLGELGAAYRKDGQLGERIKRAIRERPQAAVERSLNTRLEKTMRSRWGTPRP